MGWVPQPKCNTKGKERTKSLCPSSRSVRPTFKLFATQGKPQKSGGRGTDETLALKSILGFLRLCVPPTEPRNFNATTLFNTKS